MKGTAIDLFAGAGGLSEGLKQAGFHVALANELNQWASETYRRNHPETILLEEDIHGITPSRILKLAKARPDLVAGGPPCQGFSMAGKRSIYDPRNHMFFEFIRIVRELKPRFILAENVTGLLTFMKGRVINKIEKELKSIGYKVSKRIINSADFGVPQIRNRLFIFGDLNQSSDISSLKIPKSKWVTVKQAIGDLDFLNSGESSYKYMKQAKTLYQKMMRERSQVLHNHKASKHSQKIIDRFSCIKPGMKYKDLKCETKTKKRNQMRIFPNKPINTINTIPDDYIHYLLNRTLTVRESARLQSFKDKYIFLGQRTTGGKRRRVECPQYTQVGNAIPPLLARGLGKWVLDQI